MRPKTPPITLRDAPTHGGHGVAAAARRRVLHRLLPGDAVRHQPVADQEALKVLELVRQLRPELPCLRDERRDDHQPEEDDDADDREVDDEDRHQPRDAPPPVSSRGRSMPRTSGENPIAMSALM